jgi:hypothetical protein
MDISLSRPQRYLSTFTTFKPLRVYALINSRRRQPNTIGLALYDNPVGQLAWIAEKIIECAYYQSAQSSH